MTIPDPGALFGRDYQADGRVHKAALISPCGAYRYWLQRWWDPNAPALGWIMLNPSTADADVDDATVRRVIGFSKAWGFGQAQVCNLFAFRSTEPDAMFGHADPIGPTNDSAIHAMAQATATIVCAWGAWGSMGPADWQRRLADQRRKVAGLQPGRLKCLGLTLRGEPRHPLYVKANTQLQSFTPRDIQT